MNMLVSASKVERVFAATPINEISEDLQKLGLTLDQSLQTIAAMKQFIILNGTIPNLHQFNVNGNIGTLYPQYDALKIELQTSSTFVTP